LGHPRMRSKSHSVLFLVPNMNFEGTCPETWSSVQKRRDTALYQLLLSSKFGNSATWNNKFEYFRSKTDLYYLNTLFIGEATFSSSDEELSELVRGIAALFGSRPCSIFTPSLEMYAFSSLECYLL
jgi:hypothetical protein